MGISELDEPPSPVRSAAGLTSAEVAKAREQWGPNVLERRASRGSVVSY